MQKYIRQVTTQRSWIGRLIKVKLARVFFTLELSTAAQHCCVSSKAKEKYSQINAHSSANPGFGFLWNWLTPIKENWTIFFLQTVTALTSVSFAIWCCCGSAKNIPRAATLSGIICPGQSRKNSTDSWIISLSLVIALTDFISPWWMEMIKMGEVADPHVKDNNGTLINCVDFNTFKCQIH